MVKTWEVLPTLGFEEAPDEWSSGHLYELDLGIFRLKAAQRTNQYFREVIALSGDYSTDRTVATISFELPTHLASSDHVKALIAHYLRHLRNQDLNGFRIPHWVAEGKGLTHLLPWRA